MGSCASFKERRNGSQQTLFHCSQAGVGLFAASLSRDSRIKTFLFPSSFFIFFHIVCVCVGGWGAFLNQEKKTFSPIFL